MRYLIEYGPDDKRNRWGYLVEAAPVYKQYTDSYEEAKEIASKISREHRKWTVSVLDTKGPQDDPEESASNETWLIFSCERGKIYYNENYMEVLHKTGLFLSMSSISKK